MQIRAMETYGVPIRMISPGRVYRKDEVDATHSPMFHQIEGLVVDRGITMADLKGTLNAVIREIYGPETKTRFRPHHFPFTEPSCEVDIQCHKCAAKAVPPARERAGSRSSVLGWFIPRFSPAVASTRMNTLALLSAWAWSGWLWAVQDQRPAADL